MQSSVSIHKKAQIGSNVKIGSFSVIGENVKINDNCMIHSNVVLDGNIEIGKGVEIFPYACLGTTPQDLKYDGEKTKVVIGDNCKIREYVTINLGTNGGGGITSVGNNCLLMVGTHIAHDCTVDDNVIFANHSTLAGHVSIEKNVVVGALSAIHQFVRIGSGAMIGGLAEVSQDVGPNLLVVGRNQACGLNRVGLKRRCIPKEDVDQLKKLFRALLSKPVNICEEAKLHLENSKGEISLLAREFLEFYLSGTRGFARQTKI